MAKPVFSVKAAGETTSAGRRPALFPTLGRIEIGPDQVASVGDVGRRRSLLDDLTANVGPPVVGACVCCPPLGRAATAEQLLQREMRGRPPNDDCAILGIDLDALALAKPGSACDLAGNRTARFLPHRPTLIYVIG